MVTPLTERQAAVYEAIVTYWKRHDISPTVREIGELVGVKSPAGILQHLGVLQKAGWISRKYGVPRSIRPLRSLGDVKVNRRCVADEPPAPSLKPKADAA